MPWKYLEDEDAYHDIFEDLPPLSVTNIIEVAVIRARLKDSKKLLELFDAICEMADRSFPKKPI
mgnify:CR=1 FL=1